MPFMRSFAVLVSFPSAYPLLMAFVGYENNYFFFDLFFGKLFCSFCDMIVVLWGLFWNFIRCLKLCLVDLAFDLSGFLIRVIGNDGLFSAFSGNYLF